MALVIVLAGLAGCTAPQSEAGRPSLAAKSEVVKPFTKPGGGPFRVAVVQSGDYFAYNDVLTSIRDGLVDLGWVGAAPLTAADKATIPGILGVWAKVPGAIEFPPDQFIDLNWTEDPQPPAALTALLQGGRGVDLVVSLGTLAGTFVAKAGQAGTLKVPVMVESVSDPVGSKIVTSVTDSGNDHISASFDPQAYDRQVRLFQHLVGFKKLGLIYTDTETGRAYAAFDTVTKAAKDLGFQIVPFTDVMEDPPDPKDIPKAEAAYVKAMEAIGPKVDAVYLAVQAGLTQDSLPKVIAVAEKYHLPTFVMEGADFVWRGTLLGESNTLQTVEGRYSAQKLTRILAGVSPRALPQSNPHVPHIAVNLAEARRIGFDLPVDVLLSADDVFTTILTDPQGAHP
jgi:ABC-type uncharacterized transport system substrate-binding protein